MPFSQLETLQVLNIFIKMHVKHFVIEQLVNANGRNLVWELGERDIEFCQRYHKDFERRKGHEKTRKDMRLGDMGYRQKRFWKRDLQFGVLIFRFKSVKDYFIKERGRHCYCIAYHAFESYLD
ncbi:hypothetical protein J3Q64DRAFT_1701243 [Phycomyces blakesleeanus]|uniref:Uncharacterized protein n=2 Tax=Phycomyces blakesleeanus TaxID=4837 RepID=A0A162VB41_PHYB8|nr:hypothetical protein PHYBLDRAFT_162027 [Phycomyces blakesleeanus NRRL 1555(-)]OAD81413.1 hypothetical protein PHYBLDRAFT_162027 [Phycomyces blakesleeanus NRRL 1555(-)]|eukprot:XP_018299453.1 hypothetical protein PHYBLDRAFT_162027 [Phycomyces blakesleeanus NRRL 1555(-)]